MNKSIHLTSFADCEGVRFVILGLWIEEGGKHINVRGLFSLSNW